MTANPWISLDNYPATAPPNVNVTLSVGGGEDGDETAEYIEWLGSEDIRVEGLSYTSVY